VAIDDSPTPQASTSPEPAPLAPTSVRRSTPGGRLVAVLERPVPRPPDALRRGPFRLLAASADDDTAPHDVRSARLLGAATGTALAICFVTGLISHVHQHPLGWLDLPSRPVWGYQLTQGLHVATGIALVPLVLAKLWVVFPRLFTWPPARTLGHALERALIAPLVAGTLFELAGGLVNIVQWYPWRFFFPRTHWAVAWVVAGAVLIHLAIKAPLLRRGGPPRPSTRPGAAADVEAPPEIDASSDDDRPGSASRRALVLGTAAAVGAVTVSTVGQTIRPLDAVSVLALRRPSTAPDGVPINRTAAAADVRAGALDPAWLLVVDGPITLRLGLADLAALPQYDVRLPIACVEGWSATALWSGVRLRDVLDLARVPTSTHLTAVSLETNGIYGTSPIAPPTARDPLTLLALRIAGATLSLDHGYPLRLIAPNRPGVLQTKWLSRIEVSR
jgi:hypothetical protein